MRCDECVYWVEDIRYDDKRGQCHRNAPIALRYLSMVEESPFGLAFWPMTNCGSWCGMFVPKQCKDVAKLEGLPISAISDFLQDGSTRGVFRQVGVVRIRKCMHRLGISTVEELVERTGDDLLECKNFGISCLNAVRDRLSQIGLCLKGESVQKA